MTQPPPHDAHRHIGRLPPYPFYGLPPVVPAPGAPADGRALLADMDRDGVERALVVPNYGVPDPAVSFALNDVALEAGDDDRVRVALWVSPRPEDAEATAATLSLAGESPVAALKLSFLLGGAPDDEACAPQLDAIFAVARTHGLVVHVHTSPGGASDIDRVGALVDRYGDDVAIQLIHLGGGVSGHIKLVGGRFFDWVAAGKRVYTDWSWSVGFAARWMVDEIERRGVGHDRVLFASDEPWSDLPGELARASAAAGDGELGRMVRRDNFESLYGQR